MPDKKIIGQRLRKLRGKRSLAVVAKELGVSPMTVWYWENGIQVPRDEMKVKVALYYKRNVATLFYKD